MKEKERYEGIMIPAKVTTISGIENPPTLHRIVWSKYPIHLPKKGTLEKYRGILTKMFPCLKDLADQEIEDIVDAQRRRS